MTRAGRKNAPRYRKIVEMRDKKGMKFREIADALGISRQRAWEIYNRAIAESQMKQGTGHIDNHVLSQTRPA